MSLPNAIIVDIDGTIAEKHPDRDIFEFDKVHMDLPIKPVLDMVHMYMSQLMGEVEVASYDFRDAEFGHDPVKWGYHNKVIFVSGRSDKCKWDTLMWLLMKFNKVGELMPHDIILHMRKHGDNRDDAIVKREIYEDHIKDKYNIEAIFDDRPRVIRMWRELGLFVFNCCQHDEEF